MEMGLKEIGVLNKDNGRINLKFGCIIHPCQMVLYVIKPNDLILEFDIKI